MNTAQLSQTLLAAWRQRDRSAPWGRWLIAALVVLTTAGSLVWFDGPKRWMLPTVVLLVIVHASWMIIGSSLQEQNHPTAARCVPGHVAALRQAGLIGWVVCAVLSSLLLWAALPQGLSWQSLLLGNAAAAAFVLWTTRAWWLWLGAAFYAPLLGVFKEGLAPLWQAAFSLWAQETNSVLVLSLVALALLVWGVFGTGDERHRRAYARQSRVRQAQQLQMQGKATSPAQLFPTLERLSRPFEAIRSAAFQRLMARADNRSQASVMNRAEWVLQGNQHWIYQLMVAVSILLFVVLSLALVVAWTSVTPATLLEHGAMGMGIGLASMAINPTLSRATLWQTRQEQALLLLMPGMPRGTRLNRAIAWMGLRHALGATALVAVLLLPLALATDKLLLMWMPLVAVPCAIWTTTASPARMRSPSALSSVAPVMVFLTSASLGFVCSVALAWPLAPAAATVLSASALLGVWRWRRLDQQPSALPAGRLS